MNKLKFDKHYLWDHTKRTGEQLHRRHEICPKSIKELFEITISAIELEIIQKELDSLKNYEFLLLYV